MYVNAFTYIYIYACMYLHISIYTYKYTYTYTYIPIGAVKDTTSCSLRTSLATSLYTHTSERGDGEVVSKEVGRGAHEYKKVVRGGGSHGPYE